MTSFPETGTIISFRSKEQKTAIEKTNSRSAGGKIAYHLLRQDLRESDPSRKLFVWTPDHQGLRNNEAVDAAARALTYPAPHTDSSGSEPRQPLLWFRENLIGYCEQRQL